MVKYDDQLNTIVEDKEKNGTKDFLIGAIVGGVVGAAVALWLSPKSGAALREEVSNQTSSIKEKAGSLQTKVSDIAQVTKEKTNSLTKTIAQQSQEAMSKIKGKSQNQEAENQEHDPESLQLMLEETKKAFDETEENLNH